MLYYNEIQGAKFYLIYLRKVIAHLLEDCAEFIEFIRKRKSLEVE